MKKMDIGLIGLAVMGQNLVLNMEDKGYGVAVYNRTVDRVDRFIDERAKDRRILGTHSIEEFCGALKRPRTVMLVVKAGQPVDDLIEQLLRYLEEGDIILDGGNSYFKDTVRRAEYVEGRGIRYMGVGISGGEEGALKGPSIMPGGSKEAWERVRPILQGIAAKVSDGSPCCEYMGPDGAGHFVKMVHNGIEYVDSQLICEAYFIMKMILGLSYEEMQHIFEGWNRTELDSYLIEITADILGKKDPDTGKPIVEIILDRAAQKGTGKWASKESLDLGVSFPTVAEAVFARTMSSVKKERVEASRVLRGPKAEFDGEKQRFIEAIGDALYAAKVCSYAQGFALLEAGSKEYGWNLKPGAISLIWRNGCVIRAKFLDCIRDAFSKSPELENLLLDPFFRDAVGKGQENWRWVVSTAASLGVPAPVLSSSLAYYDSYRSEILPANLLQAMRDYFGAHTYERVDREGVFHTNWLEIGN
ncbi:MAG TPA: NADP-dependent phosphogluconate dehydrogenase [Spirochaetota bacterium]|nr:NADP-dependent phosphogluconate dehydrogenase [Spirochaetota bacterium]